MAKDDPICSVCQGWMEEKGEWLVCMSCKFHKKSRKIKITPLPKRKKQHSTFNDIGRAEDSPGYNELVSTFNER